MNIANQCDKDHIRMNLPVIILWEIWKMRNESKFKSGQFKAAKIISKIMQHIWTITSAGGWKRA